MRKYLFLFCLFFICIAINAQSSSEYKYLYFGGADEAPKSYVRINKDPVVLTFIKEIEAIRLTWEGDDLTFYIKDAFHWHIDIRPVVAKLTTSSWAANICINPVSPEDAAKHLREVNQL